MSDEEARALIRGDLRASFIVEASAGTGKTTELVRRIVAVLASGVDVGRIAAVTFTDKAAGELKLRLRSQLEVARRTARAHALVALEKSLARLEEARVSTIHTFAADLLRERPVEAGVDPGFLADGETQADMLFEQAFDDWLHGALERPGPGLSRALSRRTRASKTEELLRAAMILRRLRHLPATWERRPWDRESSVAKALTAVRDLAALSGRPGDKRDYLFADLEPVRAFVDALDRAPRASLDDLEGRLVALTRERSVVSPRKGRGGYGPGVERADVQARHVQTLECLMAFARDSSADLATLLRAELDETLVRYAALKERRGVLDFDDLLLRARELLATSPEARQALQQRLSHVFVDEFQDTDPIQASILLYLASNDHETVEAFEVGLTPGKLFVVGDPKQSIYRFRNADLGIYDLVKDRVTEAGGKVLTLTRSFRAVPGIQALVNGAFAARMVREPRIHSPAYSPLEPVRHEAPSLPSIVLLPSPGPYGRMRLSKKAVADSLPLAIAAFLEWLIGSGAEIEVGGERVPIKPGHVCLLFKHLESFGASQAEPFGLALSARDIPHVLVGGRSFYDRDEISAALAALSAIERPDDTLHVVATLRGLFFGITDDAILEWKLRYGRVHPLSLPITALPESVTGVGDALGILGRLHRLRNRRPFAETLRELFDKTRAHVSLALLPNGEQALANVHHLMHLREDSALSFRGFIDALRERADKRVAGEAPILEEAGDGVRMMTVHRAKGLEFPIVVLADPTARMTGTVDRHIDAPRGLGAARILGLSPWELVENEALEEERDRAESVRVGYVAATRARDMLIVPIVGDEPTFPEDGWLAPLHTALAPHIGGAPSQPASHFRTGPLSRLSFGDDSVLVRPQGEGPSRKTVVPGVHTTPFGPVVVWDPAILELDRPAAPRVRGADLIAQHADASTDDQRAFHAFQEKREARLATQRSPSLRVVTATQAAHGDEGVVGDLASRPVERHVIPRADDRPSGPRFGDLVHQTLATIELSATAEGIARVVTAVARILGAPSAEARAAEAAVLTATRHPLWLTFMGAEERGDLRREVPLACTFADQIMEGVVDVAYFEDGVWTVIDFKTDRPDEKTLARYERQVLLYVLAIERATGKPARGALLFL